MQILLLHITNISIQSKKKKLKQWIWYECADVKKWGQIGVKVKITVRKHCKIKGFRDIVEGSNPPLAIKEKPCKCWFYWAFFFLFLCLRLFWPVLDCFRLIHLGSKLGSRLGSKQSKNWGQKFRLFIHLGSKLGSEKLSYF